MSKGWRKLSLLNSDTMDDQAKARLLVIYHELVSMKKISNVYQFLNFAAMITILLTGSLLILLLQIGLIALIYKLDKRTRKLWIEVDEIVKQNRTI
jgi:hypothetical protein